KLDWRPCWLPKCGCTVSLSTMAGLPGTVLKSVPKASHALVMLEKSGICLAPFCASADVANTAPAAVAASRTIRFVVMMKFLSARCGALEIGFGRDRDGLGFLSERVDHLAIGAARFRHCALHLAPLVDHVERLLQRSRVFDRDIGLKLLAALDQVKA